MKKEGEITKEKEKILYSKNLINPKRDWTILVVIFLVSIALSISFDIFMYKNIVSGEMFVTVNRDELSLENLKIDDLKKVLANFDTKKSATLNYKLEHSVDPAI